MSPYFLSVMLGGGGRKSQCDFDQKCCLSTRHHFRILKIALLFHTIQNQSEKKYSCYDDAYMYLTVKNLAIMKYSVKNNMHYTQDGCGGGYGRA